MDSDDFLATWEQLSERQRNAVRGLEPLDSYDTALVSGERVTFVRCLED